MNVAAILKQKGRAVTTASPSTTLLDVAGKLASKRIGAIVIVGARGEVSGIISERDIVRSLSELGPECLKKPVSSPHHEHFELSINDLSLLWYSVIHELTDRPDVLATVSVVEFFVRPPVMRVPLDISVLEPPTK